MQPSGSTASTIRADTSAQVSLLSNADVLHPPESAVSTSKVDTSAHVLHHPGSDQVSLPSKADVIQPAPFVDPPAIISISPIPSNPSTANIPRGPKIPAEENSPVSKAPQGEKGRTAASSENAIYQPSVAFRCNWATCGKGFATVYANSGTSLPSNDK